MIKQLISHWVNEKSVSITWQGSTSTCDLTRLCPKLIQKMALNFPRKNNALCLYKQPVQGYQRRIARWDNYNKKISDKRPVGMSLLKVNFDDPSIWQVS